MFDGYIPLFSDYFVSAEVEQFFVFTGLFYFAIAFLIFSIVGIIITFNYFSIKKEIRALRGENK